MKKINLKNKFKKFSEHWSPKVIAELKETINREVIISIKYFPLCTTANLQEDGISRSTERNHEKTASIFPLSFFCLSFINLVGNDLEKE